MSEQRIFRSEKSRDLPYTRIDNRLLTDSSLSFCARGLMCFLLSKPNEWVLVKENLINSSPAGSTRINSMLRELQEAGYVQEI